ncbi:MAG: hypothetical protein KJ874_07670 [Acidobacteria bacterium]|nr:hypothetical protein [Acidobacteriota bacterium]
MRNNIPIPAIAIDLWRNGRVATSAMIIRTTAIKRSVRGARLKNAHHMMMANPPKSPPITPIIMDSGITKGMPNLTNHCSETITTPGHSLSGFRRIGSSDMTCIFLFEIIYSSSSF